LLSNLTITDFRNIHSAELSPTQNINLLLGDNGSGKTSLLEAIHILGVGRSFRSQQLKNTVNLNADRCVLFARSDDSTPIGMQYDLKTGLQIRLNNAPLVKVSELALNLPLQYISANCHQFFELGPKFRRKLVDWGVFHVEHHFNYHWQSYKKASQQRNSALKHKQSKLDVEAWNNTVINHGEHIANFRHTYLHRLLDAFIPIFTSLCTTFKSSIFTVKYNQGWAKDSSLHEILNNNFERDRMLGYSRTGPHSADWTIKINDADPSEMLSRGQQKLFFLSICIAQIEILLQEKNYRNTILLIDDISSELDWQHQVNVIKFLRDLPVQVFMTSTDKKMTTLMDETDDKVFHVELGEVKDGSLLSQIADT